MSSNKVAVSVDDVLTSLDGHPGVQSDRRRRELNVEAGKDLCERCDGTGNQFYAMYSRCPDCDGLGFVSRGFD